ncbi:GNAT family N-acetyltransferase [Aquibacillus sp. 3ASR75-11]|uniref:GNAT family N-acetyltransferase n=1 Tax=Terrihalobacillus insolitus TaxID=2950438 RepID=A0A9X3WTM4_9BACI|nr:GNAT family N-acetyltransferase [Terrihalobacillus insolitus]MDC3412676.1 GNAT family N-acetyltransferase [Terrihalobacillus insolitus]MDC3424026.1 GNAT family N-acetyltransferase [Terrihalobacillus insolitus]
MEHKKEYHAVLKDTEMGAVVVEGPVPTTELKKYHLHEGLDAFRPAPKQFQALLEIADFEEGRLIIARNNNTIVGYVTYLYPDPLERWSVFQMEDLIELGAIEVAPEFRGAKLASSLLKLSMMDEMMENYIIISTEYYWHWDLKGTQLSVWDYRKVMEKMMFAGGLTPSPTDDPEIVSHPANCLMVKVGKNVPESSIKQFDRLRFLQREKYRSMKKEE